MGGSSRILGCGIIIDAGLGGMITTMTIISFQSMEMKNIEIYLEVEEVREQTFVALVQQWAQHSLVVLENYS